MSPCHSDSHMKAESSSEPALTYRPDIDGLRGLAVLSVIGFHAGRVLPGGYVGVDIFFVISGFLITSIICRQLADEKFSFVDFYARRSKRIFPSLIVVLVAVWICGWMVLLPDEYASLESISPRVPVSYPISLCGKNRVTLIERPTQSRYCIYGP